MFLDAEKISYLRARPEVELSLSFRTDGAAAIPGVWFNYVLTQNSSAESVVAKMRGLLNDGYRRFNILPAFFTMWDEAELRELERSFAALERLFRGLWGAGDGLPAAQPRDLEPLPALQRLADRRHRRPGLLRASSRAAGPRRTVLPAPGLGASTRGPPRAARGATAAT